MTRTRWHDRRPLLAVAAAAVTLAGALAVAVERDEDVQTTADVDVAPLVDQRERSPVAPSPDEAPPPRRSVPVEATASSEPVLQRFASCGEVAEHVRAQALEHVSPYGLSDPGMAVPGAAMGGSGSSTSGAGGEAATPTATAGGAAASGDAFSTTNVQEVGVDEPDVVKNDGRRAFTLVGRRLRSVVFDDQGLGAGDSLELDVGDGAELLEVGDHLVVLSPGPGQSTRIIVVRTDDPASLTVSRQLDVEGTYLSARRVGDTVRLVVTQSGPAFDFTHPRSDHAADLTAALAHNRAAVARSELAEWLPDVTFDQGRRLVPAPACDDVYLPATFAGPGSTTVLTLSPADGAVLDATAVLATASEVYATAEHLYVATSAWRPAGDVTTEIHRFAVSDPTRSVYEASGSVAGHLIRPPWFVPDTTLAQWSLSEHDDHLRVATTVQPAGAASESIVTVLRQTGDRLLPVGALGGLGRGEQLYAVRFMGDRGYVVTYLTVDPLYVLDLADPTAPRVVGELKVPGYSAYLHPIDDDRLLGIGQDDPDEDGLADGTQVSLFDVADPAHPRRLAQAKLGERGTVAGAEGDHRSFTWWPDPARAIVTLANWEDPARFHGAVALDVGRDGVAEVGRVEHRLRPDGCAAPVLRSRVVGDALITFSSIGVRTHALHDLAPRSTLAYDDAADPGTCPAEPASTSATTTSTTSTTTPVTPPTTAE